MIVLFLRQHLSWICLVFTLQVLVNGLLYLDDGIVHVSYVYLNLVWLVLFASFCAIRYIRDYKWMKQYPQHESNYFKTIEVKYEQYIEQLNEVIREKNLVVLERQDELLAWVHEMKSPLTALQLLTEKIEDPSLKERMEHEWLRLYLLLDQQLHSTRLMTMEQDTVLTKVYIRTVVASEVKALRSWFFEKNIALEMDDLEVEVLSDAKWLGFIVRQVLTNAVKYSEPGREVRVYTTVEHGRAVLHIEDQGIGIAAEDLPRVFRKSYTGTIGRETSAATGMGLYLAKQAAEPLQVKLAIDSTVGVGTTVHLYFSQANSYLKTLGM